MGNSFALAGAASSAPFFDGLRLLGLRGQRSGRLRLAAQRRREIRRAEAGPIRGAPLMTGRLRETSIEQVAAEIALADLAREVR